MKHERYLFATTDHEVIYKSDKEMHGHLGLHDQLPKGKEFPVVPPKGKIYINKKLTRKRRKQIAKHERYENYLMKKYGFSYQKAHRMAQKWERH